MMGRVLLNRSGAKGRLWLLEVLVAALLPAAVPPLRDDSRITSPLGKGTVPFSLRENRDSPQLVLASSLSVTYTDLNGAGLEDVVFCFGPDREFGDAGALDADSTEVLLTGSTIDGTEIFGLDDVAIVGGGN